MILVTGSNGFIGKHIVSYFSQFDEVLAPSRSELDISDSNTFDNLPKGIDAVFHVAAYVPESTSAIDNEKCTNINALGTKNVLEYCRKNDIKKIIYSSSASVYQRSPDTTEEMVDPINFYGKSKLDGEKYCIQYSKKYGINYVILRYATVYGLGQKPRSVLPIFFEKALKGEDISVWGRGERTQDFVYIQDVVEANKLALKHSKNEIFNIGSGFETSMIDLAKLIQKIINSNIKIAFRNVDNEDVSRFYLNINKAKKELKYLPKYPLELGLKDMKGTL